MSEEGYEHYYDAQRLASAGQPVLGALLCQHCAYGIVESSISLRGAAIRDEHSDL